tara:strand:+ start:169 stop:591 length:423 start_codon:yes stop_codon:yes gene_type:complete
MKSYKLKFIGFAAIFIGALIFEHNFPSWNRKRINKKNSEEGLQRLVDNYGLKIQNPIDDFNQCDYQYALAESGMKLKHEEYIDKELIDKDTFMVNCIPVIQEVLDKCDCFRNDDCKLVHIDKIKSSERDCFEESGLFIFK